MEASQAVQNPTVQTAAVVNQFLPALIVGVMAATGLIARSKTLGELAQSCRHAGWARPTALVLRGTG